MPLIKLRCSTARKASSFVINLRRYRATIWSRMGIFKRLFNSPPRTLTVHDIGPDGSATYEYVVGRDISTEDVAQWADNGNLYVLHAYEDGVKNKFFCRRSQWIESRQQLIDIDDNFTAESRFAAGLRYVQGEGGSKDTARALRLFEAAAAEGHAGAQHNLGVMYAKGDGVQRDLV